MGAKSRDSWRVLELGQVEKFFTLEGIRLKAYVLDDSQPSGLRFT
jgi:hypothetical protein